MGWLKRLFGLEKPDREQNAAAQPPVASAPQQAAPAQTASSTATAPIPPERVGLHGEYDQSGLAKRVARAFDEDAEVADIETVFVAQLGSTVVLKGKVPSQAILNKLVSIARNVHGATAVQSDQVRIE